jgi:hypothetical protein
MEHLQLTITNGQQTISSLQLVEYINQHRREEADNGGKNYIELLHKNVLAKIIEVLGENTAAKFLATDNYTGNNGAKLERKIYNLPEREACLMAMSYSYSLQAKVYDAFQTAKIKLAQVSNLDARLDKLIELMMHNNSNLTALVNNLAIKHEPKVETPKYFQPSFTNNSNEDIHLYHRITIYGKKFRPDLDQSQIRDRAKEIGMMASRLSKERNIQIIKEDNLDGRFQNKISYYHQNVLKEVFDLIF